MRPEVKLSPTKSTSFFANAMRTEQSALTGLVVNVPPASVPPHVPRMARVYPEAGITVNEVVWPETTLRGVLGVTVPCALAIGVTV